MLSFITAFLFQSKKISQVSVMVAVQEYIDDHKMSPNSLTDLVPEYLPSLPAPGVCYVKVPSGIFPGLNLNTDHSFSCNLGKLIETMHNKSRQLSREQRVL